MVNNIIPWLIIEYNLKVQDTNVIAMIYIIYNDMKFVNKAY